MVMIVVRSACHMYKTLSLRYYLYMTIPKANSGKFSYTIVV